MFHTSGKEPDPKFSETSEEDIVIIRQIMPSPSQSKNSAAAQMIQFCWVEFKKATLGGRTQARGGYLCFLVQEKAQQKSSKLG